MSRFREFCRSTHLGRLLLIPWRLRNALMVVGPPVGKAFQWAFTSREHYNFTYDLDPLNRKYLVSFAAVVTGQPDSVIARFFDEIENDETLKSHVSRLNLGARERFVADATTRFGRRIGWYAMVRATKPRLVVETGVDKGLGSCVLAAALKRNAEEGSPGRLLGIDINPKAGYLFQEPYSRYGDIRYQDSFAAIGELTEPVDFFIHDSDHSAEHEAKELSAIRERLSTSALVLSDNADQTDELLKFANATGRHFLYFADKPLNHWWTGDGIGVAFPKIARTRLSGV